jgi:hypothetical protein
MKVALILASNTCYAPYMHHYIRILNEEKIAFDIIIWNKDNIAEDNCISYNEFSDLKKSRLFRVKSYFGYAKFVKDVLNKNEYKRVVVFTIFLGILLYPYLKKEFKKSYFFDIRDYSPILNFIPWILRPIINDSFSTTISSPGFTKWLPKSKKYLLSHNYHFNDKILSNKSEFHSEFKYTILTIGFLRDFEMNKIMINSFKNDSNILMKFVGRGIAYEPLMEFVKENEIKNVIFTGAYDKKDEIDYLNEASLINILLGDDINSNTLMTNRLYLAISNGIPVIVNVNSTQGEYVNKYNLGIVINDKETINEAVLAYLDKFNSDEFLKGSAKFLSDIIADQEKFEMSFKKFII